MKFLNQRVTRITIEGTNICALKCPACARQKIEGNKYLHDLNNKQSLSLNFFQTHFNQELAKEDIELLFSGNYGDIIYHPDFLSIMEYLKEAGFRLHIETNGSNKPTSWWNKLAQILTVNDQITFSIDGLDKSNGVYRINSNFKSIIDGIKVMTPVTKVNWKFIVFSHNEHEVEQAKDFAKELGVHTFKINKSGRFRKKDELKPKNPDWIGVKTQNKTIIREALRTRNILNYIRPIPSKKSITKSKHDIKVLKRCETGTSLFLSNDGYLYPCCAGRDIKKGSWFLKNREEWNLNTKSMNEIISSDVWMKLLDQINNNKTCPEECLRYCGVSKEFIDEFGNNPRYIDEHDNITFNINEIKQ